MWSKRPYLVIGLSACVLAVGLLAAFLLSVPLLPPSTPALSPSAFAVMTIFPAGTATPVLLLPTFTPPSVPTPTASPLPGTIAIGVYVEISGTGVGLRIRSAPGLDSSLLFIAADSEVFQVSDGPRQADGYTWWYLVAPYDNTRAGWAVQDYLLPIPPP